MSNATEAPEVIMFVRHGEKPGEGTKPHGVNHHGEHDGHSLSVLGWTRAGALAGLFAHAPSTSASAHRAARSRHRHPPHRGSQEQARDPHGGADGQRLKLAIEDGHTHGNEAELVAGGARSAENALVVWHHGTMAKIVRHFPIVNQEEVPKHWPDERFDLIWVLVREPGEALAYRFVIVPQMLLADDVETV